LASVHRSVGIEFMPPVVVRVALPARGGALGFFGAFGKGTEEPECSGRCEHSLLRGRHSMPTSLHGAVAFDIRERNAPEPPP
jgi:hypothetical protein